MAHAGCRTVRLAGPDERCLRPLGVLVGNHACNFVLIRLVDHRVGVEMPLALRTVRSQDMALKRVTALELACRCLLEALGGSTMCLQLRHNRLSITTQTHVPGQCWARAKLKTQQVGKTRISSLARLFPSAWKRQCSPVAAAATAAAAAELRSSQPLVPSIWAAWPELALWAEPESGAACCLPGAA